MQPFANCFPFALVQPARSMAIKYTYRVCFKGSQLEGSQLIGSIRHISSMKIRKLERIFNMRNKVVICKPRLHKTFNQTLSILHGDTYSISSKVSVFQSSLSVILIARFENAPYLNCRKCVLKYFSLKSSFSYTPFQDVGEYHACPKTIYTLEDLLPKLGRTVKMMPSSRDAVILRLGKYVIIGASHSLDHDNYTSPVYSHGQYWEEVSNDFGINLLPSNPRKVSKRIKRCEKLQFEASLPSTQCPHSHVQVLAISILGERRIRIVASRNLAAPSGVPSRTAP
ncbi:hypothetical protein BDP55DRAFT_627297 [Colletotrichum godetiae]|uniref:Uncharacterized protein n=1 Tax=Colletotrichum godetiae TaxID=1209918 RepID=A0AAJ0AWL7_9PEZI|nr:uncharacterized protein BDP55DRAFT_627297 [Colletotrichum godetiae]KAK1691679.1 hypothetical protein BDP55DRAFT_627297 [Colletotrichum godetiae]